MAVVMGLSLCLSEILDYVWIPVDSLYVSFLWWLVIGWLYSAHFWLCSWPGSCFQRAVLVISSASWCVSGSWFHYQCGDFRPSQNSVMWLAVPTAPHRWSCVSGCPPLTSLFWGVRVPVCNWIELLFLISYSSCLIVKTASRWRWVQ